MKKAFLMFMHAVGLGASGIVSLGALLMGMVNYGSTDAIGFGFVCVLAFAAALGFSWKLGELKNAK